MEWPHDPDGEDGSEGGRVYGMALFAKKVTEEDLPLVFEDLEAEIGHHPIRIDHGRVVPAADILAEVDLETVEDLESFHRAIGRAMRSGGYWSYDPAAEIPNSS